MKPARFEYARPSDIAAALGLIRSDGATVKVLAGGQSLGPLLNLRLVQPDLIVDITGIAELKQVEESADGLTIGSCITHADVEDGRVPDVTGGPLREIANAHPDTIIGSYPFLDENQQPNTNLVVRSRDQAKLTAAMDAVKAMVDGLKIAR